MRKESEDCFNRAVLLAPKEPDVYLSRANIQSSYGMMDLLARIYRDRQPLKRSDVLELYCSEASVRDLNEAARLCPDDERVVATAAWLEISRALLQSKQQDPKSDFSSLDNFPEKARNSIRAAMNHLEALSATPDKKRSAGALMNLGILEMMTGNSSGAKVDFRRAVALEPTREKAWEVLLTVLVQSSAPPEELVNTCEGLLKSKNSAKNRLLLAKALIKQNKLNEAKVQIQAAAMLEPENILPYLFAGAVSLKQSDVQANIPLATTQLTRAKDLLRKNARWRGEKKAVGVSILRQPRFLAWRWRSRSDRARKMCANLVLGGISFTHDTAKDILSAIE